MTVPTLFAELGWRELLCQHTDGLEAALAAGPLAGYCGFDPTASSLHVGNLVPVMGLVHLQRAGHRPVALVGGGTGMIGDPSGRSTERTLLDRDAVAANTAGIRAQLERFLDFDGPRGARLVDNAEWLEPLTLLEFLRDTGKHFSVNYMLAKDSVKSRLDGGISFTEFAYMLLQAHDFRELHRRLGVTLQLGGSDQWGNITAGLELIRRTSGAEAHALTLPLVTRADGTKFGKSASGAVWLDAARTSPYRFYQYWLGADDRDVGRFLRYFTLLDADAVAALDAAAREHPERREAQRALAADVTTRVHGAEATRAAEEVSTLLFAKGDVTALSPAAFDALTREIPCAPYAPQDPAIAAAEGLDVAECLVALGLAASRGAVKRLLEQGGVSANGERLGPGDRTVPRERLVRGRWLVLRKGAREYGLVDAGVPA